MLRTTPQERQALGVTALLLAAGAGVRLLSAERAGAEWENPAVAADTQSIDRVRSGVEAELARAALRDAPLAPGERIDPNRATAAELERLPRVGPALAGRIVEWRRTHGPLRSLADLDRVPGVGPALLERLAPHLALPAAPPGSAAAAPLDLNRATAAELDALPGIGPVLAERIVEWRRVHGPFRSLQELEQVPGIGPALRARLEAHLRARP